MTPEGRVKQGVKRVLATVPRAWYYMPVQNGMGRSGIPDFIACIPTVITPDMVGETIGVFMAVETKAPGKGADTTANQDRELHGIRTAGGVALVVTSPEVVASCLPISRSKETHGQT